MTPSQRPTDVECAYAASVIDSDGSISIARALPREHNHNPYYKTCVRVSMVNPAAVTFLSGCFGGKVHIAKARSARHKDQYVWAVYSQAAAAFLLHVVPHLRVKLEQALLALQLSKNTRDQRRHAGNPIPSEELALRHQLYLQVSALNKQYTGKGPQVTFNNGGE